MFTEGIKALKSEKDVLQKRLDAIKSEEKKARAKFLSLVENEFGVKIPPYARKWMFENFRGGWNSTGRITITRSGYNKSLKFFVGNGILKRKYTYPFSGYGESFEFTKNLFPERPVFGIGEALSGIESNLKKMGLL